MPGMVVPYDGQSIVGSRCSNGRCHSASASGDGRVGAPADLDFDVLSSDVGVLTSSSATVIDWAEDMWEEVEEGSMPPAKPAGSGELSGADKEKVRNWLACGAPVIPPDTSAPTATWDSIWPQLASNGCTGCHSPEAPGAGQGFALAGPTDSCTSYNNIFEAMAITSECAAAGETIVKPGDPAGSLLYKKLTSTAENVCGDPMPIPSAMGLIETRPELVAAIQQWIMSGAPKPTSCP
jgi:hypothetical protein